MKAFCHKWKRLVGALAFFNVAVYSIIVTIFPETKKAILDWIQNTLQIYGAPWLAEGFLFIAVNLIVVAFWLIFQIFWVQRNNGAMRIAVGDDSDGKRIEEFQYFRAKAKKNVLIMGIGMSGISKDTNRVEEFVKEGKDITFLIMDPDVLVAVPSDSITNGTVEISKVYQSNLQQQFQKTKIAIDDKKFSEFYLTDNYRENIKAAIGNLQNFVNRQEERRKECKDKWNEGEIKVFKYSYYIPLNVTISDKGEANSKLIVEFCLPFSTKRIRAKFSHGKVKELIEQQIDELLQKAELIDESRWIQ